PDASLASLVGAALSSPSSRFKRPLASLSFAANYLVGGMDPFGWKLVNLIIHLLNGLLVFVLVRWLIVATRPGPHGPAIMAPVPALRSAPDDSGAGRLAALVAGAWLILPINLTAVLYVVQRMESLANLFVLLGLVGYVAARRRMLAGRGGLAWGIASVIMCTVLGLTAKETAVMLPLYAFLIEWLVFGFRKTNPVGAAHGRDGDLQDADPASSRPWGAPTKPSRLVAGAAHGRDRRLIALFMVVLWLPLIAGLVWLLPGLLQPGRWASRDFTLGTRLLSEARVVVDYLGWTLLPLPQWLSFYHDDFVVSQSLLAPWTTLASILAIALLLALAWWQRRARPLLALGIALYFGCHLLTATILPLELIYEHRNYFASIGLLLAVVPLLWQAGPMPFLRRASLAMLTLWWLAMTAFTAWNWGDQLRLAADLANRAPQSPRALYEYGRTLLIYSRYDPASPYTPLVYAPLERAAALPRSSILPQQALLFFNARMGRPMKAAWWDSLIAKLKSRPLGVQDDSSLAAMTKCAISGACPFDPQRMVAAFNAAMSHPHPRARLLATYSDYSWNVLHQYQQAVDLIQRAILTQPDEPAYHITLARMAAASNNPEIIRQQITALQQLNYGGRLDKDIAELRALLPAAAGTAP
ncbi:MAG TPA: hypothetical protein VFN09_09310, partial [Rhodanobacteraceae bacterium]|nr:hypothetical protein [Rhodanobacteraceae bacterium]